MPSYWPDDTGGHVPSYPVSPPSGGHPGGWAIEPSETFSTPPLPVQTTVDTSIGSQPTTSFVDTTGGDSGFTSDTTTNPYYTTGGTFIPEQKPLPAVYDKKTGEKIQAPSDYMVGNVIADALAQENVNPGYSKSWAYNPKNPDNLGTYDKYGNFKTGKSPTLGSIFSTDSSGNPILDSSGNPIKTNYGTDIINYVQESLKNQGPVDLSLYGVKGPTGFFENVMSPEELKNYQDTWWQDYSSPGGGGGYEDYGYDYYGDRHQAKMDLLTALASGAPAREMEQSGFFDTLVDPYAEPQSEALQSGIFSGLMPGYTGEGMKRLLRSYGSGLQAPRYANVAKGGIVELLGV